MSQSVTVVFYGSEVQLVGAHPCVALDRVYLIKKANCYMSALLYYCKKAVRVSVCYANAPYVATATLRCARSKARR